MMFRIPAVWPPGIPGFGADAVEAASVMYDKAQQQTCMTNVYGGDV
jgi:hypothetical protein